MQALLALIIESTPLFLTGVFVFGLLIGSFLNVVILRVPARMMHDPRLSITPKSRKDPRDFALEKLGRMKALSLKAKRRF